MPQISKFLFETDFADPDNEHAKTKPDDDGGTESPVFSEAELLSAREHGYEAGIAAGQAQALAGVEKHVSEVIESINSKLDAVQHEISGQKALAAEDVAILAGAIATKITGIKSDESRLDLLERMITDCMARLYQAPEVTAQVPADLEADLKTKLSMTKLAIAVSVIGESSLSGTDCRLTWHGGGAERVEARMWQDIETLLEQYVAGRPAGELPDQNDAQADAAPSADQSGETADMASVPEPESAVEESAVPSAVAEQPEDAPAQPATPLEQDGGQPERLAPGDQDG